MLVNVYQVKKLIYYFTIFLFSLLFFSFSSFASCIKIEDDKFVFLPQDGTICTDKATRGILKLYSNPDAAASDNKLDTIIAGRSDTGYSMHFTFDRDGSGNLSGDQILFAAYENMSGGTAVAKAGIRSGEFFYEIGSQEISGVNMNALNDVNISNPHIAIIVYDSRRKKVILNIDGVEVVSENIEPISGISRISRIEFGQDYTGKMGMMYSYATKLSIQERVELVGMLAHSVNVKVIKAKRDEGGILVSGIDREEAVKCREGKTLINRNCQSAIISGFVAPVNSVYAGGSDIIFDSSHRGQDNAKVLSCKSGFEINSVAPKYWFTLNGDVPSVNIEGSCREIVYYLASITGNVTDPGAIAASELSGYSYDNPKKISCIRRHSPEVGEIFGIYIDDNNQLKLRGECINTGGDLNCYNSPSGTIGDPSWNGCANMLIVNNSTIKSATTDLSFDFKPNDGYTSHTNDITYTMDDGPNRIFTGQVTSFFELLKNPPWAASPDVSDKFRYDIGYWDTSSVTNMRRMFAWIDNRAGFVQNTDLSGWDVSQVTDMSNMFEYSSYFNNNNSMANWNTSSVTNMTQMFRGRNFNGNIANWDTRSVTNMANMFSGNQSFNQDISGWDVSKVTHMGYMFSGNHYFNHDISGWDTSSVTNMRNMFNNARLFNVDISGWDTSSVTDMRHMFANANVFNQDISTWCVSEETQTDTGVFSGGSALLHQYKPPFGTSNNCN
jgi:surface protein